VAYATHENKKAPVRSLQRATLWNMLAKKKPRDAAGLSVTDSCRDGAVITQHDVSGHDSPVNMAHSQGSKAATTKADTLRRGTLMRVQH